MTRYLLDANVLIALTVAEHDHHDAASHWLQTVEGFAVCPIVEGALVRFLLRIGESGATAHGVISGVRNHPDCALWPDDVSFLDLDLSDLRGHRQVTDVYLAGLAAAHSGLLATFDAALANLRADQTHLIS